MTASHPSETAGTAEPSPQSLPEYWPVEAPVQPECATWLPWPIAVVLAPLFWLMPKRMGIHFAESRWTGAIIAHLLWTTYGIGCIAIAVEAPRFGLPAYLTGRWPTQEFTAIWPPPTLSEALRAPVAVLVDLLRGEIKNESELIAGLGFVLAVELGLLMLAAALMPYAAAGERTRRLFGRCVKLTLWSTTSLVVLGLALQVLTMTAGRFGRTETTVANAVGLYAALFVWMWLRSGLRYAGPPEGPGWAPRFPRCEGCTYRLTGLTAGHRCPECGLPVSQSLPDARRPPPFGVAKTTLRRIPAYFRTVSRAWTDRLFYQRLAILNGHADARRFAIYSCLISGFVFSAFFPVDIVPMEMTRVRFFVGRDGVAEDIAIWAISSAVLAAGLVVALGLIAIVCSRFGLSPIRRWATIAFYQADWLLAVVLTTVLATLCIGWLDDLGYFREAITLGTWVRIPKYLILASVCYALPVSILLLGGVRLSRALKQTRFANG